MKTPGRTIDFKTKLVGFVAWRLRPAWLASRFKQWMQVKPILLTLESGSLVVDPISNLGMRLIRDGFYEPELTAYFRRTLKPGDTFVDIGANEGFFSVLANTVVGTSGKVVAVEPQSRLQARLRTNFEVNAMRNFRLLRLAVGDQSGEAVIHLTPDMNSGASGLSQVTKYQCDTEKVELTTLSDVLDRSEIEVVHLMKMDIESFEYEAILGSKQLFTDHRIRHLAVELHPEVMRMRGREPNEIVEFLTNQGYRHEKSGPVDIFSLDANSGELGLTTSNNRAC